MNVQPYTWFAYLMSSVFVGRFFFSRVRLLYFAVYVLFEGNVTEPFKESTVCVDSLLSGVVLYSC